MAKTKKKCEICGKRQVNTDRSKSKCTVCLDAARDYMRKYNR